MPPTIIQFIRQDISKMDRDAAREGRAIRQLRNLTAMPKRICEVVDFHPVIQEPVTIDLIRKGLAR